MAGGTANNAATIHIPVTAERHVGSEARTWKELTVTLDAKHNYRVH
jgi:hypothetical protein